MPAIIKITRKQLFDDMVEMSRSKICEKYSISLNELNTVLKEKNIPCPDELYMGYHFHKKRGKNVPTPTLSGDFDEVVELHCVAKRRKTTDSSFGSKANTICLLQTLEDYSDANKALTVCDIIRLMKENYRLEIGRRTIYKTVELLINLGYDISVTKEGGKCYYALLDKVFEPYEAKIIMDSLSLNPLLSPKTCDEINNKIDKYLAKRRPGQNSWFWHSFDEAAGFIKKYDTGDELYRALDEIDAAHTQCKKLSFNYIKYDTNKNEVLLRDERYVVTTHNIEIRNFSYYLFCTVHDPDGDANMSFRIDRMRNVCVTDEDCGSDILGRGTVAGTYDYGYTLFGATMKCDYELLPKITDDFANKIDSVTLSDNNDGKTFTFCPPTACYPIDKLAMWAASVCDKCEVIEPVELREKVIGIIKNNKYGI